MEDLLLQEAQEENKRLREELKEVKFKIDNFNKYIDKVRKQVLNAEDLYEHVDYFSVLTMIGSKATRLWNYEKI